MEDGQKGSDEARPTYWLDACEEDDIIPCDFVDFANGSSNHDDIADDDNGLSSGIDHILDSIKRGAALACQNGKEANSNGICIMQVENSVAMNCDVKVEDPINDAQMSIDHGTNGDLLVGNGGQKNGLLDPPKANGAPKVGALEEGFKGDRDHDSEESSKRAHSSSCARDERSYLSLGQSCNRDWGSNARKRGREWDENGRRDRDKDRDRRRDYYSGRRESRDREWREREAKGYWEREKPGSKEIVYRIGLYEADRNRDGNKVEPKKNQEFNGKMEKNEVNNKEKNLEEQARQYQLDVLEQAKQKNTIAFLETGAGKTLIAVLLMKSIRHRLQLQNKKMLAIFLVPKVPLVYQVM